MKIKTYDDLETMKAKGLESLYPTGTKISVGMATCGLATGAQEVYDALQKTIEEKNLDLVLTKTGCLGYCQKEPLVDLLIPGMPRLTYMEMTPERAVEMVETIGRDENYKDNLLCKFEEEELLIQGETRKYPISSDMSDLKDVPLYQEVPFFAKQTKIVLRNCGFIDPESIEQYIARGGYQSLYKVLTTLLPENVIEEIKRSGLRGRGGAGFPTGRKWEFCRSAKGEPKYIICNADEGDPGAYMDRSVLEGDPYSVLEGMLIGAYAIGASQGYIYVRSEYPLAIKKLEHALKLIREYGVLGKNIFNSGFNFELEIIQGSGAFVCGEETSMMASIEGRPAEPRQRPPFPALSGLWGKPTNINNVETWANVAFIIARGADYFSEIGKENNSGTKVFSLVGKVQNNGLVEVPMGISVEEIIYDIGGGVPNLKRFKAVQTGGPSGGCVPRSLIDLPVDYENLKKVGSIMGSGGMIVMDEDTCLVDIAKFFLAFTRSESCGKCTSCREGSDALLEVLTRISEGKGEEGDLTFLEELCWAIKNASLCALGQTLPNPVLSTIQHYRDEYEAHIKYKRCPAVVCKQIISSPCQHTCPLEQDASCYVGLIAQGKFKEAFEIVREKNPLPSICGRVCTNQCEYKCRSGEGGEPPIAIRSLKRFLADYAREQGIYTEVSPKQKREERVAVVGSGPAGLACAHYLALEGYGVTIFESLPVLGGMLAVGIPEYRLPREVLNFEIEHITTKLGVEIKTNTTIGKDILLPDLKKEYNAIFLAIGAHKRVKIGISGEEAEGVKYAVEFLRQINLGQQVSLGNQIIVIGGGNTAIDVARVAERLGKTVKIIYRRTKGEMPAIRTEVEGAFQENIEIQFLATPVRIIASNGKVEAIECIRTKLGAIDATGRRRPVPVEGSEFTIKADTVVLAIGQQPDTSFLTPEVEIRLTKWGTLEVDPETLQTNEEGIFAGGDVLLGPASVPEAMAQGKIAAQMICKYLQGQKLERKYAVTRPLIRIEAVKLSEEEVESLRQPKMPVLSVSERIDNFKEVELGFTESQAIQEARRCLRCDLELQEDIEV